MVFSMGCQPGHMDRSRVLVSTFRTLHKSCRITATVYCQALGTSPPYFPSPGLGSSGLRASIGNGVGVQPGRELFEKALLGYLSRVTPTSRYRKFPMSVYEQRMCLVLHTCHTNKHKVLSYQLLVKCLFIILCLLILC